MARVTIEDCLENVPNRFALVIAASRRARALHGGVPKLIKCKNKEVVSSLREIAARQVEIIERPSRERARR